MCMQGKAPQVSAAKTGPRIEVRLNRRGRALVNAIGVVLACVFVRTKRTPADCNSMETYNSEIPRVDAIAAVQVWSSRTTFQLDRVIATIDAGVSPDVDRDGSLRAFLC